MSTASPLGGAVSFCHIASTEIDANSAGMNLLRRYLASLTIAALVLTGHSMAQARTMASPTGEIVLCTGTGPITVLVDENGQPTGRAHVCPDCALSLFADIHAPVQVPGQIETHGERVAFAYILEAPRLRTLRATARGPPPFV